MIPKVFRELLQACNECILSCEECIRAAESCEKNSAADSSCKDFIIRSKSCAASSEVCIKACNAMITEFQKEGVQEHMEALNNCVKELGENIRILGDSALKCTADTNCSLGCKEGKESCNKAIAAVDACIESCEKHEVVYDGIKKY